MVIIGNNHPEKYLFVFCSSSMEKYKSIIETTGKIRFTVDEYDINVF